jgi:hypothetical protein
MNLPEVREITSRRTVTVADYLAKHETESKSSEIQGACSPAVLKFAKVALSFVVPVCLVTNTVEDCVTKSTALQTHPLFESGRPITPFLAVPPTPTLIVNAAVPLAS